MKRLGFLDATRGIAVLLVVISHFLQIRFLDFGAIGVGLFFLVSGFIIPASIENKNSLKVFWISRFWRLFPLYWFNIILWLLFVYVTGRHIDSTRILANFTSLPWAFGEDEMVIMYWTLNMEMIFYLFITVFFAFGILKRTTALAITFLVSAIILDAGMPERRHILSCIGMMLTGTVFYRYSTGTVKIHAASLTFILAWVAEVLTHEKTLTTIISRTLIYAIFLGMFFSRNKQSMPSLRFMGEISYSVYLNHMFVAWVLASLPVVPYYQGSCFPATFIFSIVTYRLIERPAINFGKYLTEKKKTLSSTPVMP